MSTIPPGWGFPPAPDAAAARADRVQRQTSAMHAPAMTAKRRASRVRIMRGRDREMHFRFVLWARDLAKATGRFPRIRDVTDEFGISANSASKYLRDLHRATRPLEKS